MESPQLDHCLAYVAACDWVSWLGRPSPQDLSLLLAGAAERVQLSAVDLPEWRVFGPLEEPEFYLPLVARTGHPTLTIKWATALELLHFNLEVAMRELQQLISQWAQSPGNRLGSRSLGRSYDGQPHDLGTLLRSLARRPAMYLGANRGWALRCYLHGMQRGGDWLSLPPLPTLEQIIRDIEEQSTMCYGTPFAGYRVYDNDVRPLLAWAGVEPDQAGD